MSWNPDQNSNALERIFEAVDRVERYRVPAEMDRKTHICPNCQGELSEGRDQYGNPRICTRCSVEKVREKFRNAPPLVANRAGSESRGSRAARSTDALVLMFFVGACATAAALVVGGIFVLWAANR